MKESESTSSKINPIDFNPLSDEMTLVRLSLAIERSSSNAGTELFSLGTTGLKYRNPDTQVSIANANGKGCLVC